MDRSDRPSKKGSAQHERTTPPDWGNNLVCYRLIAPSKLAPFRDHSSKEILVLTGSKLRPEGLLVRDQARFLQQQIARSSLCPSNDVPCRVSRPFVELALYNPLGRLFVEVTLDRSEYTVHVIFVAGLEQRQQPTLRRELVVVDESDQVFGSVLDGLIPRQGDILLRLHAVVDRNSRSSREVRHQGLRRLQLIVVGHHDRISEPPARLLIGEVP